MTAPTGATEAEWQHFANVLGLAADILPVVPDPNATPTAESKVKEFGKIPSCYDAEGHAYGLAKWQEREVTPKAVANWMKGERYSLCIRASRVRAIDVDVPDEETSNDVWNTLDELGLVGCPRRIRENSYKFLVPVVLEGAWRKRIIKLDNAKDGPRIEFLADGQQWVAAGCHPSGARYEFLDGLPSAFPTLSAEQFEKIWSTLAAKFGTEPSTAPEAALAEEAEGAANSRDDSVLTDIDDRALTDLVEALQHEPLLANVGGNTEWSEVGYALLSLGALGRQLWHEFVGRAANVSGVHTTTASQWWEAHATQDVRSDYRHIFTLARRLGWSNNRVAAPADFAPIPAAETGASPEGGSRSADSGAAASSLLVADGPVQPERTKVPEAKSRCTDLANANRLYAHFGKRLLTIGGRFYWFNGKWWEQSETEALRCAAMLGQLIKMELDAAQMKLQAFTIGRPEVQAVVELQGRRRDNPAKVETLTAEPDGAEVLQLIELTEALKKWMKQSEMGAQINSALKLLRDLVAVDANHVDMHHHLINCANGTVDLHTGEMKPHNADDRLTNYTDIAYNVAATCPRFEAYLDEILDPERAKFLQRWLGYCLTGETREQKFLVHIGQGGNGKGTLVRVLESVLGSYVRTAASNLLVGSEDRHPTEVAMLRGARLVISQEPPEGDSLREAFVKQVTGQDTITARFMRQDHFSFRPLFKLNLLTNYKPVVKSQEQGIWRRILVVWYKKLYGSATDVSLGVATNVVDPTLEPALHEEREGILRWMVEGARLWYQSGLTIPPSVQETTKEYRTEQDRVQQFIGDCCILDPSAWSPYSGAFGGLYPAYTAWCKENSYPPLGSQRFIDRLAHLVPGHRSERQYRKVDGVNKQMRGCFGVRVNTDGDGGGSVVGKMEDLV